VVQERCCVTVLTWPQFLPRLPEFGRYHVPRKWGRLMRRLVDIDEEGAMGTESPR
jgi:hypothetical protein